MNTYRVDAGAAEAADCRGMPGLVDDGGAGRGEQCGRDAFATAGFYRGC